MKALNKIILIIIFLFNILLIGTNCTFLPHRSNNSKFDVEETTLNPSSNIPILEWNLTWGGSDIDEGNSLAIDSSDNIFIVGTTYSFGEGQDDMALIKYSSSGIQDWNTTWGSFIHDRGHGVAVDLSDNVLITGGCYGGGLPTWFNLGLIKFSNLGIEIWNKRLCYQINC